MAPAGGGEAMGRVLMDRMARPAGADRTTGSVNCGCQLFRYMFWKNGIPTVASPWVVPTLEPLTSAILS
jgi:hypothetical protein